MGDIRKERVFKSVKFHLNELKRLRPKYEWVMIAHQGSYNYNLDMFTEEYQSDVDTIAVVLPSFEDFVDNKNYISETIVLDNNEHIDVKDIRLITELFKKQNIKYLEILHTEFRILNPKYKEIILDNWLDQANAVCRYNPEKLVTCTFGMAKEKEKALEHPYEGLKDKIEKYGYDGKQLHHIIRLACFLNIYIDSKCDFNEALNSYNYPSLDRLKLDKAKLSEFSLERARAISDMYIRNITTMRQFFESEYMKEYMDIDKCKDMSEKVDILLQFVISKVFKCYFESIFAPENKQKDNILKVPTAEKIFVTSDLHFGHENILKFEDKRWELCGTNLQKALVDKVRNEGLTDEEIMNLPDELWNKYEDEVCRDYIQIHDEELIKRWNDTVRHDNDLVFILGDLSFRKGKETNEIIKRLRGRKVLVLGNHDDICIDKNFDKSLFEEIVTYKEIIVNGRRIVMFHFPITSWRQKEHGSIHLYGHVHTDSHEVQNIRNSYNVGVDVNNFKPVCLENYLQITKHHDLLLNASKNIEKVYKNT